MDAGWASIILGLLGLFGIGNILVLVIKARQDRRKIKEDLSSFNAGKSIDADVNAFNAFAKRLEIVESRLDTVHSQLMDQRVENAKLEAENIRLSKENERQAAEITELKILVDRLTIEVRALGGSVNSSPSINVSEVVKVELVDPEEAK